MGRKIVKTLSGIVFIIILIAAIMTIGHVRGLNRFAKVMEVPDDAVITIHLNDGEKGVDIDPTPEQTAGLIELLKECEYGGALSSSPSDDTNWWEMEIKGSGYSNKIVGLTGRSIWFVDDSPRIALSKCAALDEAVWRLVTE